jgi:hypothetical protein
MAEELPLEVLPAATASALPACAAAAPRLWPIFDSLILKALVIQSVGSAAGV